MKVERKWQKWNQEDSSTGALAEESEFPYHLGRWGWLNPVYTNREALY